MVVGWEFDVGWGDNFIRQFNSWTIMAKPRLPHMWQAIQDILAAVEQTAQDYQISVGEIKLGSACCIFL